MLASFALERIDQLKPKTIYVGLSGGIDSVVLLHLASDVFGAGRVVAIHINHGLQSEAEAWQAHSEMACRKLGVRLESRSVTVDPTGSLETRAREARYAAFQTIVEEGDVLLLAHHRDDQVETIIHNLLRGSSTFGLMGMPAERALGHGWLIRPLLECSRADIESFARKAGLSWIEDPSNRNQTHTRNAIRHRVLPLLEASWPDVRETLLASMRRDASFRRRVDSVADDDLAMVRNGAGVNAGLLAGLPEERQFAVIRRWLDRLGLPQPTQAALAEGLRSLLTASEDRAPQLSWQGICLRRYQGEIFLGREAGGEPVAGRPATGLPATGLPATGMPATGLPVRCGESVFGDGLLVLDVAEAGISQQFDYVAYPRSEGMMMTVRHSRPIKKVMQEAGIPPWLRHRIPVICVGKEVAALPALPDWGVEAVIADKFAPKEGERGLLPAFRLTGEPYSD